MESVTLSGKECLFLINKVAKTQIPVALTEIGPWSAIWQRIEQAAVKEAKDKSEIPKNKPAENKKKKR